MNFELPASKSATIAAKFCCSYGATNAIRGYLINLVFFGNIDFSESRVNKCLPAFLTEKCITIIAYRALVRCGISTVNLAEVGYEIAFENVKSPPKGK